MSESTPSPLPHSCECSKCPLVDQLKEVLSAQKEVLSQQREILTRSEGTGSLLTHHHSQELELEVIRRDRDRELFKQIFRVIAGIEKVFSWIISLFCQRTDQHSYQKMLDDLEAREKNLDRYRFGGFKPTNDNQGGLKAK